MLYASLYASVVTEREAKLVRTSTHIADRRVCKLDPHHAAHISEFARRKRRTMFGSPFPSSSQKTAGSSLRKASSRAPA